MSETTAAPDPLAAELAAITKRNEFASDRYAEMRARIRSLLPYNVNCCDGFGAAVADLIGEHGDG